MEPQEEARTSWADSEGPRRGGVNKREEAPFPFEAILEAIWIHSRMWNAILESESELGTLPSFSLRPLWGPCEAYPQLVGFVVDTFFHVFFLFCI